MKRRIKGKVSQLDRIEGWINRIAPDLINRLERAENAAQEATQKYKHLRQQLIGLLTRDQLEAAQIAGCPPEIYAIEWLEIWKQRILADCPIPLRSLKDLRTDCYVVEQPLPGTVYEGITKDQR